MYPLINDMGRHLRLQPIYLPFVLVTTWFSWGISCLRVESLVDESFVLLQ